METIIPTSYGCCEDKIVCLAQCLVHSERSVNYSIFWSMPWLPQFWTFARESGSSAGKAKGLHRALLLPMSRDSKETRPHSEQAGWCWATGSVWELLGWGLCLCRKSCAGAWGGSVIMPLEGELSRTLIRECGGVTMTATQEGTAQTVKERVLRAGGRLGSRPQSIPTALQSEFPVLPSDSIPGASTLAVPAQGGPGWHLLTLRVPLV